MVRVSVDFVWCCYFEIDFVVFGRVIYVIIGSVVYGVVVGDVVRLVVFVVRFVFFYGFIVVMVLEWLVIII